MLRKDRSNDTLELSLCEKGLSVMRILPVVGRSIDHSIDQIQRFMILVVRMQILELDMRELLS